LTAGGNVLLNVVLHVAERPGSGDDDREL
jgi:hypothetical protein